MGDGTGSPRILSLAWGKIEVENLGQGKDFMLWPGGGCPWDWNMNGTSHSRGIHLDDVKILLDHGAAIVVLTRGMFLRLRVPDRVKQYLESKNIELVVASTKEGVRLYNEYAASNKPVAGLFHSTC